MRLGKTNLEVNKNGFGALPIQRRNMDDSVEILLHAYENGIDFYDTAHFYTDSEAKLGKAFEDVREDIYLASKGAAEEVEEFWNQLETSLKSMKTDYLDLYQFHNISFCPKSEDDLYKAMLEESNLIHALLEEEQAQDISATLRISASAIMCNNLLPDTIQYFQQSYPRIDVDVSEEYDADIVDSVYHNKADIGFVSISLQL